MPDGQIPSRAWTAIIVMAIVSLAILFWSVAIHNIEVDRYQTAMDTIQLDHKALKKTSERFQEKRKALDAKIAEHNAYVTKTDAELKQLNTDLTTTKTTLASTEKQLTETRDRLKVVESQKDELKTAMDRLEAQKLSLDAQIADLRAKLQTETKDKEFLLSQVKDLEAKRAELEKKWNDLAALRTQVRTLVSAEHVRNREELAAKRGYFGAYQKTGLRNYKTYEEVRKEREKLSGATTIEVYREGNNPPPKPPQPPPSQQPPKANEPKVLQPGQQPTPK